jgi:hypothetical protein
MSFDQMEESPMHERAPAAAGRTAKFAGKPVTAARDAIALAFEEVGGVSALAAWVEASEDNRKIFYATIYAKIIPLQPGGDAEDPVIHEIRRTFIRP